MEIEQERNLYKIDTTKYATEGVVLIVKASTKKGKALPGIALTKRDAINAAQQFLDTQYASKREAEIAARQLLYDQNQAKKEAEREAKAEAKRKAEEAEKQIPDESSIQYMPWLVFRNMIQYLGYKDIVKLCNTSNLYKNFCEGEEQDVWNFLLKRDFNPLLQVDIDALDNDTITPMQLYYKIQKSIKPAKVLYNREYRHLALSELCGRNPQNYYGALWLLKQKDLDTSYAHNNAIRVASREGYLEIVRLLLIDPRVDPSDNDNFAIGLASRYGRIEVVRLLLTDPRIDPGDNNNYAIAWASQNGHLEVVRLLLTDPRVDPSDQNNQAIRAASDLGHLEVIRLLMNEVPRRVDPSDLNNQAIIVAGQNGHLEIVKLLLTDPRIDPTDQNNLAIIVAGQNGHLEIVKLLLTNPRVNPTDQNNLAIIQARNNGHSEIVKLFKDHYLDTLRKLREKYTNSK